MSNEQGEQISHDPNAVTNPSDIGTGQSTNLRDYSNAPNVANINPEEAAAKNDNWAELASKKGSAAKKWANQNGVMKIIPTRQIQLFSYSTVGYILNGMQKPVTQIIPLTNVSVNPHQVSFDFFSTTEGTIGISNAAEKVMQVECDVYVTDLVYYWWNNGTNDFGFNHLNLDSLLLSKKKQTKKREFVASAHKKDKKCKETLKKIESWEEFELTPEFADMRNNFLTCYTGWECKFVSHAFPSFYGVLTEIKYDISEGETSAKWHLKIEEALFLNYSDTGKKEEVKQQGTSGGTATGSGDVNTESSSDNGNGEGTE